MIKLLNILNEWTVAPTLVIDYRELKTPDWSERTEPIIYLYKIADGLDGRIDTDAWEAFTANSTPFDAAEAMVDKYVVKLNPYYSEPAYELYKSLPQTFYIKIMWPSNDGQTPIETITIQKAKENPFKIVSRKYSDILNEWKVNPLPKGWKELSIDPDPDLEENIEIESYGAPMDGWDFDHLDIVSIHKTPGEDVLTNEPLEVKYYVGIAIAFGDYTTSDYFNTYSEAKSYALEVMNKLTKRNDSLNEWKVKQSLYHKGQTLYANNNEFGVVLDVLPNYEAAKSIYGEDYSIVLPDDRDMYFGNLGPNAKDEYWYLLTNDDNTKWLWNEGYLKFMLNMNFN